MIRYYRIYQLRAKARMRTCTCAGRCKSAHFEHARKRGPSNISLRILIRVFDLCQKKLEYLGLSKTLNIGPGSNVRMRRLTWILACAIWSFFFSEIHLFYTGQLPVITLNARNVRIPHCFKVNELAHETDKIGVRQAKTQISLGIRSV